MDSKIYWAKKAEWAEFAQQKSNSAEKRRDKNEN